MKDKAPNGTFPIVAASVLWAFGYFARKWAMQDISPFLLNALIAPIVAIFIYFYCRLDSAKLWQVFSQNAVGLLVLSISGVMVGSTLMMVGLDRLDLGVATILEKLQPIFTLFMAGLILKERLSPRLYPYCALALMGAVFVSSPHPFALAFLQSDGFGLLAIVGAAFSWGIASVMGRKLVLRGIAPEELTFFRFFLAAVLSSPLLLMGPQWGLAMTLTPISLGLIVAAGIFSNGLGYILYYRGLKTVDATTANFLELVTPVVSLCLGFIVLGETLALSQWLAIPVMLFAVLKIALARR